MTGRRPSIITAEQEKPGRRESQSIVHISSEEKQNLRNSIQSTSVFDENDEDVDVQPTAVGLKSNQRPVVTAPVVDSRPISAPTVTIESSTEISEQRLESVEPDSTTSEHKKVVHRSLLVEKSDAEQVKRRRLTVEDLAKEPNTRSSGWSGPSPASLPQLQTSGVGRNLNVEQWKHIVEAHVHGPHFASSETDTSYLDKVDSLIQAAEYLDGQNEPSISLEPEAIVQKAKEIETNKQEGTQQIVKSLRRGKKVVERNKSPLTKETLTKSDNEKRILAFSRNLSRTHQSNAEEEGAQSDAVTSDEEEEDLFLSANEQEASDGAPDIEAEEPVITSRSFVDENGVVQIPGVTVVDPEDLPKVGRGRKWREVLDGQAKQINEETFTMADLCKDMPIGAVNEDFERWERARQERKQHRELLLAARREAKRQGIPYSDIDILRADDEQRKQEVLDRQQQGTERFKEVDKLSSQAPQMILNENNVMVVDPTSTALNRHELNDVDNDDRTREEIDKYKEVINNSSFSVRDRPERWDDNDNKKFYQAISTWGTDFNLIAQLFPGRSRRQIKSKFKLEEKRNPAKIHLALMRQLPLDISSFAEETGAQIREVDDIERELQALRDAHEHQKMAEAQLREDAKQMDAMKAAKREQEIYGIMPNEEIVGDLDEPRVKEEIKIDS